MADLQTKISIRANGDQARRELRALRQNFGGLGTAAQRGARQARAGLLSISTQLQRLQNYATGFLAISSIVAGLRGLARTADSYKEVNARLALAERNQQAFNRAQAALRGIARETRNELAGTVDLYARITRSTKDLKATQDQRLAVTRAINQALVVSGARTAEGAAAVFQLTQGLASGQLRGEELNSVLEQTPRLAQAIADGLGVGVGQLRGLAEAGQLTSERVLPAILSQAAVLNDEFAQMPLTIGRAGTVFGNAWRRYIGQADQARGVSTGIAETIVAIADNLKLLISTAVRFGTIIVGVLLARAVPALQVYIAGQLAALRATQAAAAQELIAAEARAVAAHRALRHAEAMVAEAEAAVAASAGMRRLAIVQQQLVPARAALTRATQAHTVALEAEALAQMRTVRSFRLVRSSAATSHASVNALKTGLGTLAGAANLLFAAFSGWQIGGWLRDNFAGVRQFGVALVGGLAEWSTRIVAFFEKMGVTVEYALVSLLSFLRTALADFLSDVAAFAAQIPGIGKQIAAGLQVMADAVKPENAASAAYEAKLDQIERDLAARLRTQQDSFADLFADAGRPNAGITLSEGDLTGTPVPGLLGGGLTADEIKKQLAQVRIEILRATGETAAAQIAEIEAQYGKLLAALQAQGDTAGVALVEQLIDVQSARARFDELAATADVALDRISQREQAIQAEQQAGLITELQARDRILALHRETGAELDALLPRLQALAEASGDPRAVQQVARLRLEIRQLGRTANEVTTRIRGAMESGFADAFASILDGTKSASEAFGDMADSIIKAIYRIIAEMIATQLVQSLFQAFGFTMPATAPSGGTTPAGVNHTGGIAGIGDAGTRRVPMSLFAGAPKFHGGGILSPGEVPIIARRGEGIFTEAQMAALAPVGAGGDVKVEVNNYGQERARVERSRGPDGSALIRIVIGEVAGDIRRGGQVAQAMETTYGASRVGR